MSWLHFLSRAALHLLISGVLLSFGEVQHVSYVCDRRDFCVYLSVLWSIFADVLKCFQSCYACNIYSQRVVFADTCIVLITAQRVHIMLCFSIYW